MAETNKSQEQQRAEQQRVERQQQERDTTANAQAAPATRGPRGADGPPPSHEETLGALPVVPKDVAEEYQRTGRTPRGFAEKVVSDPAEAERMGVPANPGTPGQAQFPEDQEKAARDQQREADQRRRQREPQQQPQARRPS